MSNLPNFPELPGSVGGYPIPDFLSFEIVGDGELPSPKPVKDIFDFSIKKSPVFGSETGLAFDEGSFWHPLRAVDFTLSTNTGLIGYQGHYQERATEVVGKLSHSDPTMATSIETYNKLPVSLNLHENESITGFRVYLKDGLVEGLRIWTTRRLKDLGKVHGEEEHGKDPEAFFVPEDHEIVNFYGYTNDSGHIHGLGASYNRRLSSIQPLSSTGNAPKPRLDPIFSRTYMDAATQQAWANGDMKAIEAKKVQATKDLSPIFTNIDKNGDKAWKRVKKHGQEFWLSWTSSATIWAYVIDKPGSDPKTKKSIISVGSYSRSANFLGISGYIWNDLPSTILSALVGLGFAYMIRPLIQQGVEWGISYAAQRLAGFLAAAGVEEAALLVPASVATAGGLVIAGILGVLISFGILALFNIIFKKYWLVLDVYNFDPELKWGSVKHYDDNAKVSNGTWKTLEIPPFVPAGDELQPPGFDPVETLDNVVTYLCMTFDNVSTILQGLGEGVVMSREDKKAGLALKYVVHRFTENEIGLKEVEGDPSSFNLGSYYNNGPWVQSQSVEIKVAGKPVTGYTPKLSGAKEGVYNFEVNIGLPPSVAF